MMTGITETKWRLASIHGTEGVRCLRCNRVIGNWAYAMFIGTRPGRERYIVCADCIAEALGLERGDDDEGRKR